MIRGSRVDDIVLYSDEIMFVEPQQIGFVWLKAMNVSQRDIKGRPTLLGESAGTTRLTHNHCLREPPSSTWPRLFCHCLTIHGQEHS